MNPIYHVSCNYCNTSHFGLSLNPTFSANRLPLPLSLQYPHLCAALLRFAAADTLESDQYALGDTGNVAHDTATATEDNR